MKPAKEELIQRIAELQEAVSAMSADDNSLYATVLADRLEYKVTGAADYLSQKDTLLIKHKPQETMDVGKCLATSAKREAFFTFFFKARDEWTELGTASYMELCRQAAKKGVEITRVYMVENREVVKTSEFKQMAKPDFDAGIRTLFLTREKKPPTAADDFGIWDDELLCVVNLDQGGASVSTHEYHKSKTWLDRARGWKRQILEQAEEAFPLPEEETLVMESADGHLDHAKEIARRGGKDAQWVWYHSAWQFLKHNDAVSSPRWHREFYTDSFRLWFNAHKPRVENGTKLRILVSGLADYGMLYQLLSSLGNYGVSRCSFTVLDFCETPLFSCRWLKSRLVKDSPAWNFEMHLEPADIMNFDGHQALYDLVCTDAFLTRFDSPQKKTALLQKWGELLNADGWIITTARVRMRNETLKPTDSEKRSFVGKATAKQLRDFTGRYARELAEKYAEEIESSPFHDHSEIKELVDATSLFHPAQIRTRNTPGEMHPTDYAQIVLRRKKDVSGDGIRGYQSPSGVIP